MEFTLGQIHYSESIPKKDQARKPTIMEMQLQSFSVEERTRSALTFYDSR